MTYRRSTILALAAVIWPLSATAQTAPAIIVTAPGAGADSDDALQLDAEALSGVAGPGVVRALAGRVAGVSLSEAQGNSFQPALLYRGFSASALQGNAQGLAVYLDGARFNLPFGDTVNFDLLPDNAIESIALQDSNPVYGLNALGGAVAIATHTGRTDQGVEAMAGLGDHGRREWQLSGGYAQGASSLFLAGSARRDAGWRDYSPSRLYNGYADAGWDADTGGLHVKLLAADTNLTGNGAAPVELLAASRKAVFTHPDTTRNRLVRGSLHPWVALGEENRIEASLHIQSFRQRTLNGDLADIEPCDSPFGALCLEGEDDEDLPLRDTQGRVLTLFPEVENYGVFNRSQTRSRSAGVITQLVHTASLFGRDHALTLGLSHDRSTTRFAASTELGALGENRGVTGLGPVIRQPDGTIAPVSVHVRGRATGVFLADRVDLLPRLSAEIGLRWNDVRVALDDQLGTALDGRHRFRRLNPGVEFDYALSGQTALNLGYAQTSRAPTAAELSCADEAAPCSLTNFFVADPPLDQVIAQSFAAGGSGRWSQAGWSGAWRVSAYRTDMDNDIQFTAAGTRGRAFFRNIGRTRRDGADVHVSAQRGGVALDIGYAFIDARYRSAFAATSPDNPSADADGRIAIVPGNRLTGIPRHRATAALRYHLPSHGVDLRAEVQAQSGQWRLGDEGNGAARVPGFARFDVGAKVRLAAAVSVFVDVTNVFNRRYATFGAFSETESIALDEAPGAADPRADSPAAPRRFLMGVRIKP